MRIGLSKDSSGNFGKMFSLGKVSYWNWTLLSVFFYKGFEIFGVAQFQNTS